MSHQRVFNPITNRAQLGQLDPEEPGQLDPEEPIPLFRGRYIQYPQSPALMAVRMLSMSASTFHGYRRNQSVAWAIWWGAMGAIFPVVTPVIGLAQGFGKKKKRTRR